MRTTIRLDDHLLRETKAAAAESGKTFTEFVAEALRADLARRNAQPKRKRVTLPTWSGGGLMPGVDLDNSAALLDLMEEDDPPIKIPKHKNAASRR
jgi:hypothetical protein